MAASGWHHQVGRWRFAVLVSCLFAARSPGVDPASLPEVGYHPGGVAYWSDPYFADALAAGQWLEFGPGEWGTGVNPWGDPQFDGDGYPRYLDPGLKLRALVFGLHVNYGDARPPTWPERDGLTRGRVVLTWEGTADVRMQGGAYQAAQSSGPATGILTNGYRVYRYADASPGWLEVHDIDPADPVTGLHVWLPDPADPLNASLEGGRFHPVLLDRLAEADWGFIRFMDWLATNGNPLRDWSDRRLPSHVFKGGVLNPRAPATGAAGNRSAGIDYETVVALCNAAGKDLWVCVPHLASDAFVRNLAQLIRYGSDGTNAYTGPVAHPVHPPLDPGLRVFVEYSNEIWSGGGSFPQGDWAHEQATALGITKPQFNARRFCEVWHLFEEVFGGGDRLVNVAAVFTAAAWYTEPFLAEIRTYGEAMSPPTGPDVIAATTYFGNGIQDWAHQQALAAAGSTDPWFYTGGTFDAGGGNLHPVSVAPGDPYWAGTSLSRHFDAAFDEWTRRLLSGDAREGAGPDAVGVGGGVDGGLRNLARTNFARPVPVIAYEGGPSLYSDNYDGGDPRDDGITMFLEAMNRHPRMADVYRVHLNMAKARGLWSHVGFVDASKWGKYGQWGHLEYLDQPRHEAPKYDFLLTWMDEQAGIRPVEDPAGSVPSFVTDHTLPVGLAGQPYQAELATGGGEGGRSVTVLGAYLDPGLSITTNGPDALRLTGVPSTSGVNYVYARVLDGDGDPAWRTFTLRVVGGEGTLAESSFEAIADAPMPVPYAAAYLTAEEVVYRGWSNGPAATLQAGSGAMVWSLNMPATEADATLELALAEGEYVSVTVEPAPGFALDLRGGEIAFTVRRLGYHAPRRYAWLSSVEGFAVSNVLHVTDRIAGESDQPYRFSLPENPAYAAVVSPVEFRLYGFAGQYGGHATSLTAFKLTGAVERPLLNRAGSRADGRLGFSVVMPSPATLDLLVSTNLVSWDVEATVMAQTNGVIDLTAVEGHRPVAYYAVWPR